MSRPDNSHFDLIQVSKVLVDRWRRAGRSRERGEGEMDLGVCGNDISKQNTKCSGDMCCGILWSDILLTVWAGWKAEQRWTKDEQLCKICDFSADKPHWRRSSPVGASCKELSMLGCNFAEDSIWLLMLVVTRHNRRIVTLGHVLLLLFALHPVGNKTLFHYTEHNTETLRLQSAVYKFNNLQSQRIHVIENWK